VLLKYGLKLKTRKQEFNLNRKNVEIVKRDVCLKFDLNRKKRQNHKERRVIGVQTPAPLVTCISFQVLNVILFIYKKKTAIGKSH